MSRKGENIYKRKDGRWEGRYKMGRKENGQLKYGYLYGSTYNEVKECLYTYKLKYQTLMQLHGEAAMSYEEWGGYWLENQQQRIKKSTYCTYLYKLKRYVFPLIGNQPLNQVTTRDLQKAINHWTNQGLKATTIHVLYQILKKSLTDAVKEKRLINSPCVGLILPRKEKVQVYTLSKSNQIKLENEAKKSPLYKGLPVLLALQAGLRIGEISALQWKNIDFERRLIHIQQTYQRVSLEGDNEKTQLLLDQSKTEQSIRIVPMSYSLYKYLKKWSKKAPGNFVCSNKQTPSEPRLLTYYYQRIREKLDLNSTHFHHLRHTFATRCIESHGDIASISRLLGHRSSKTTLDIYVDSFVESQQLVIAQMEKLIQ